MADLIDRQEIKDVFAKECVHNCYYCKYFKYNKAYLKSTCDLLNKVASIQLEPDGALTTALSAERSEEE